MLNDNSVAKIPYTSMNLKNIMIINRIEVFNMVGVTKRSVCQVLTEGAVSTHITQLGNRKLNARES